MLQRNMFCLTVVNKWFDVLNRMQFILNTSEQVSETNLGNKTWLQ